MHKQTKANRYRRNSRLSRRRRGGLPSKQNVDFILDSLRKFSRLINEFIIPAFEEVYPQQSAPVQTAPVSQAASLRDARSETHAPPKGVGMGSSSRMGSDDPRSDSYAPPHDLDSGMGSSYYM